MIRVVAYETETGVQPFTAWLDGLDDRVASRVRRGLARFEDGNFGDHRGVGEGVMERRFKFGPGYRVYFGRDGDELVILLGGGSKKRQTKDIAAARRLWAAYRAEKQAMAETEMPRSEQKPKGDEDAPRN